jgi:hypothetical protein
MLFELKLAWRRFMRRVRRLPPPAPLPADNQLSLLVRALEAGNYASLDTRPTKLSEPGCAGVIIGQALQVESLECVMRNVTFSWPSRPRTLRESLQHINWHWLDLFTDGPRSFWWNVRNVHLPLKLKKDLSEFDRQHDAAVVFGPVEPAQHYCVPNCHCQQPCCPDGQGSCCCG